MSSSFTANTDAAAYVATFITKPRKRFADLPTEDLRAMAVKTDNGQASWHQWTRDMLLAFFHNRFGQYVPEA